MGKEGRINIIFIVSLIFLSLLMAFMVYAATKPSFDDTTIRRPENATINTSTARNINFTFNVTWDGPSDTVGNCSLWTNFSGGDGGWIKAIEFNGSQEGVHNVSARITANETSWINYTFGHDIGLMVWSIACRNGTAGPALNWTFNTNRTLAIDTAGPVVVQTADIFQGFNTTSTTPTITFNFTDVNGTGVNLTVSTVKNLTLNVTLLDVNVGTDTVLQKFNISTGNLTCSPSGDGVQASKCTLDLTTTTILTNGTKNISIAITDRAGFTTESSFTFTVDQIPPSIVLDSTVVGNGTNITSLGRILINSSDNLTEIKTTTFTTNCESGTGTFATNVSFSPFNTTACSDLPPAVRTLTINVTDHAGTSNVTSFFFGVDNTAPNVTAINPIDGAVIDQVVDGVSTLNYSAKDVFGKISFIGYYLDDDTSPTQLNFSESGLGSVNADFFGNLSIINFTGGSHTLIFTANDSVGNFKNTTITFTVKAPIPLADLKLGLNVTLGTEVSTSPVFRVKNDSGDYNNRTDTQLTNETYEIIINVNSTGTPFNVTLTDLDGSTASWDKINSTYIRSNNTKVYNGIQNNWTNTIIQMVYVNGSLDEFTGNDNTYFGTILFPVNFSLVQEFWWMQDETDLQSKTNRINITTECGTNAFTATTDTPCWNYTSSGRTLIRVPHFSIVVAVNDSGAPTITVNVPSPNQTVSSFVSNITVTSDAVSCVYSINGTAANKTMALTGTTCLSDQTESFKNAATAPSAYNITYTVNDSSGNAAQGVLSFNISDTTPPNSPNGSRISTSVGTTTATITISGMNESVNANVSYGTVPGTLTSTKQSSSFSTTFSASQSVSLSSLSANTLYHFNVTVCDFNTNCVKNGTFNFTTSAVVATTTTTTTTTTGGGGGAVAVSNIADSKGQLWSTIPSGSSVSLNIDKTTIAVTSVEVNNVKSDLRNVDLEVASLKDNPVSADAAAKVYQYFRINKKNIVDSDAESFKISFRVTKTWLTDNGLTSGDISLYRYKSGWNELTTSVTGTDDTYVNYEADTPGFSSFAIGVKSSVEVPEEEVAEEVPEEEVAPPEPVEAPTPVKAPSKAPVAWIIAAIVVILGIVLIVVYQKKKQQQI